MITNKTLQKERLGYLRRRLSFAAKRMRYWANLPGSWGPARKSLKKADEKYELACDDAHNIGLDIERLTGQPCKVMDVRRTFQARWMNPGAKKIYLQ